MGSTWPWESLCAWVLFSPVLVNYWTCCFSTDNCTTDWYLLLCCYLDINNLSYQQNCWSVVCYHILNCNSAGPPKPLRSGQSSHPRTRAAPQALGPAWPQRSEQAPRYLPFRATKWSSKKWHTLFITCPISWVICRGMHHWLLSFFSVRYSLFLNVIFRVSSTMGPYLWIRLIEANAAWIENSHTCSVSS